MTAHVVFRDIDPDAPASTSAIVTGEIIRGVIGFDGLLMSDDIAMEALAGSLAARAAAAIGAGCDVVLHCSGEIEDSAQVAGALGVITDKARDRLDRAMAARKPAGQGEGDCAAKRDALLAFAEAF
jgi:beta-N-acetylhexosaminidase